MKYIIFLLFLTACSTKEILKPEPTQIDKLDVYVNAFLSSSNLTACEKIVDVENNLNDYVCVETETDRTYIIAVEEWDKKHFDDIFLRISKRQLRYLMSKIKTFKEGVCLEKGIDCKEIDHIEPLEELTPYLETK